jgi:hypothetical protein
MTRIISLISIILLSLSIILSVDFGTVTAFAAESNEVYISEINYAGSINHLGCKKAEKVKVTCANDKWIELYNSSSIAVNLNGWSVGVGKEHENPQQFASTFRIDRDLIIQPNSYVVLLNSDKNLNSTLELAKVNFYSFGSLFGISGNTPGQKYVRVALLKDTEIVSKVELLELDSLERENNISQTNGIKYSIYFETVNSLPKFSIASNQYFENNFATPGLSPATVQTLQKPPEKQPQAAEALVPAPLPTQTKITTNTNTEIVTNTKLLKNQNVETSVLSQNSKEVIHNNSITMTHSPKLLRVNNAVTLKSVDSILVEAQHSIPQLSKISDIKNYNSSSYFVNTAKEYQLYTHQLSSDQNSFSAKIFLMSALILVSKLWWKTKHSNSTPNTVFLDKTTLFAI